MAKLVRVQQDIEWFKRHGYLLGQNKDKYYIVHGSEKRVFGTIWEAQQYVLLQASKFVEAQQQRFLDGQC